MQIEFSFFFKGHSVEFPGILEAIKTMRLRKFPGKIGRRLTLLTAFEFSRLKSWNMKLRIFALKIKGLLRLENQISFFSSLNRRIS